MTTARNALVHTIIPINKHDI